MRVQYTLPGYQPLPKVAASEGANLRPDFRNRAARVDAQQWSGWKQVLHLNRADNGPFSFHPPIPPAGMDKRDAASERVRWRQMLSEHNVSQTGRTKMPGNPKVTAMLQVLDRMQRATDAIECRAAAAGGRR